MRLTLESIKNFVLQTYRKAFPQGMPDLCQWKMLFRVMSKKERLQIFLFAMCFIGAGTALGLNFYLRHTAVIPEYGGEYVEGVVGQPRYINPIYGMINDTDRDLVQLLFSGLMTYDSNGQIVPDLAENYEISEDGTIYRIRLRSNLYWTDNVKLTADDVVYTFKTIQDPDYKSPLRSGLVGVEIQKISELELQFTLENPYAPFLENLTVKILPRHIWENITAQNFPLSAYNLSPVGSGPYQLARINRDKDDKIQSLVLSVNKKYYRRKPYIDRLTIKFFDSEEKLVGAAKKNDIQGYSLPYAERQTGRSDFRSYRLSIPRYFALFLNASKVPAFGDISVRQALNFATDKNEIVATVLDGKGRIVDSPIMPEIYGFAPVSPVYGVDKVKSENLLEKAEYLPDDNGIRRKTTQAEISTAIKSELKLGSQGAEVRKLQECLLMPSIGGDEIFPGGSVSGFYGSETEQAVIRFQEKYASDILAPQGLKNGTGTVSKSTRTKLNSLCPTIPAKISSLAFTLVTVDQPLLVEAAKMIKKQWEAIGVKVDIRAVDIQTIERDVIKPRNYEMLLFGEVLGAIPDPFPFWHSTQKKDPGLNLALYDNKKTDKMLEDARSANNSNTRQQKLELFQNAISADSPVVFLYRPDYTYRVSGDVKGIIEGRIIVDPSKRFLGVENWYIDTQRIWR